MFHAVPGLRGSQEGVVPLCGGRHRRSLVLSCLKLRLMAADMPLDTLIGNIKRPDHA